MARARNIKPGFFRNADLAELSFEARLLFAGLWTLADREGRLEDKPKQIKIDIFPSDSVDVDLCITQISNLGMLVRYEVDGKRYIQVTNFAKHQNPHRDEKPSVYPPIPSETPSKPETKPEPSGTETDKHSASTVQTQCKHGATSEAIGLIPDSLSPDSLIPEPTPTHSPRVVGGAVDNLPNPEPPSAAQAVCQALAEVGMPSVSPNHPDLVAMLQRGVTREVIVSAAKTAVTKKKQWDYAVGIVKRQIAEATELASGAPVVVSVQPGAASSPEERAAIAAQAAVAATAQYLAAQSSGAAPMPPELRQRLSYLKASTATTTTPQACTLVH